MCTTVFTEETTENEGLCFTEFLFCIDSNRKIKHYKYKLKRLKYFKFLYALLQKFVYGGIKLICFTDEMHVFLSPEF